MRTVETVAKSV